jgi:ABC-type Zn uptake system ZnuABC Zn-binding protein ZnuA
MRRSRTLPPHASLKEPTEQAGARRSAPRHAVAVVALLVVSLLLAGCGESKQEKAEKTVCAARAQIQTQLDSLKNVKPSLASLPEIKTDVTAIGNELKKIKDAQGDLSPARKEKVEKALSEFEAQAKSAIEHATPSSLSVSKIETQLKSAVQSLVSGFGTAFKPVECPS